MATLPLNKPLSIDDVDRLARQQMKRGYRVSEAVDWIRERYEMDAEASAFFERAGMIFKLNGANSNDRRGDDHVEEAPAPLRLIPAPATAPVRQSGWAHGRKLRALLDLPFVAADGKMRPLIDFSAADWRGLRDTYRATAGGALKKAKVAKDAEALLERYNVESARDLPRGARESLEAALEGAWR